MGSTAVGGCATETACASPHIRRTGSCALLAPLKRSSATGRSVGRWGDGSGSLEPRARVSVRVGGCEASFIGDGLPAPASALGVT
eukprot:2043400-Prymnesium_polylepis.1